MKAFDVLSRNLNLHENYLLEASAGTGKTFSIQNIVVRLLIEAHSQSTEPYLINQILVVTFTKASTRDLRLRIRSNIESTLKIIQEWLHGHAIENVIPDYLEFLFEQGHETVEQAKKRLQHALFVYDEAQIFTIHSFCARMLKNHALESHTSFQSNYHEDGFPSSEILRVVQDFFRTHIRPEVYSTEQVAIILKEDGEHKALLKAIQSHHEIKKTSSFLEYFARFQEEIDDLKNRLSLNPEYMLEDYLNQVDSYKNYKVGETKGETLEKIKRFVVLFEKRTLHFSDLDQLLVDDLVWIYSLDSKLLKSKAKLKVVLHYPTLYEELKNQLLPIVEEAKNKNVILARMAHDCQRLLKKYQKEEEKLAPDDLLKQMYNALNQENFLKQIQETYQVAIIDEFQDTDPIQWQIFKTLFLPENKEWKGNLYLVGDPKQSIYSFRQADIYTYLDAAKSLGKERCFSLNVNYRSQPPLVDALNALFDQKNIARLIPLPRIGQNLEYSPVQACKKVFNIPFNDQKGAIHFFIAERENSKKFSLELDEKEVFFPFIASEIENLIRQGMAYKSMAILVRDRFQALRLTQYFDLLNIPYLNQRGTSLIQTKALSSLIELIHAILHPYDLSAIKTALAGPLIGWEYEKIKVEKNVEAVVSKIHWLRKALVEEGFVSFYNIFLDSYWHEDGKNILRHLLEKKGAEEFYHDLQCLVDLLIENQFTEWQDHDGIIPFLDKLREWEINEDERIKRRQDPDKNGVKILSLHVSKGLEFDVVFALGLVNRSNSKEDLIPIEENNRIYLAPILKDKSKYKSYYEEIDAEKMRQLYVAMTRSKFRLYVPFSFSSRSDSLEIGEASPLELFFGRLAKEDVCFENLYKSIETLDKADIIAFLDRLGNDHSITYTIDKTLKADVHHFESNEVIRDLEVPREIFISEEKRVISSFSSLTSKNRPIHRDLEAPHNFSSEEKTIHTLPSGSETGIFLHKILEQIPSSFFSTQIDMAAIDSYITSHTEGTNYQEWKVVFKELLMKVLKTPLNPSDSQFHFSRLNHSKMYLEMPFLFSYDQDIDIEGIEQTNGLIKGVIDLVFCYNNQYFIIDWKTNWLGKDQLAYDQENLKETMKAHRYDIQAALYKEALKRYLRLVDARHFEECFGGIYYLFVRGMNPGSNSGIYFIK